MGNDPLQEIQTSTCIEDLTKHLVEAFYLLLPCAGDLRPEENWNDKFLTVLEEKLDKLL